MIGEFENEENGFPYYFSAFSTVGSVTRLLHHPGGLTTTRTIRTTSTKAKIKTAITTTKIDNLKFDISVELGKVSF